MSIVQLNTSVISMIMVLIIGQAKRAPHWGVQSRFRVIYMYVCMSSIVHGKKIQKNCMLKCVGGIT